MQDQEEDYPFPEDDFIPLQEQAQAADSRKDYYQEANPLREEVESDGPLLVVVQGPPRSGKSTLIRSLVKHYTKQKVQELRGTLTMRAGKKQRLTFVECGNDLCSMMDLAKVADLALVLIDASIGLEMETFQFLSLLKAHGMPNVMGVLNHMDFYKDGKQLRKTRKKYKKRFEAELGSGYRLFYMQGLKHELYLKRDVINMARFLSIIKYSRSPWKQDHPYLLADRFELQPAEEDAQTVEVVFHGYVRNCSLRAAHKMHLLGLGDLELLDCQVVDDPCPPLLKGKFTCDNQSSEDEEQKMAGEQAEEQAKPIKKGKGARRIKESERVLFAPACNLGQLCIEDKGGYVTIPDEYLVFTRKEGAQEEGQQVQEGVQLVRDLQDGKARIDQQLDEQAMLLDQVALEAQSDSQVDPEQLVVAKAKGIRKLKASTAQASAFLDEDVFQPRTDDQQQDLSELIYKSKEQVCFFDTARYETQLQLGREEYKARVRPLFVTGAVFQQQEEGQKEDMEVQAQATGRAVIGQQSGFVERGKYVRIKLGGLSKASASRLDYNRPLILCRVNVGEDTFGFLKGRIKKHPWYGNLLKSGDPIIVSAGWRRYQTIPVFFREEDKRNRFVKYTPQHDFCQVFFYGPFCPQHTGLLFTQSLSPLLRKFRVAATGLVAELSQEPQVFKKLKLVGEPFKIFKNTAFVRGMFNSEAQVAQYEGAVVRTVSGIRGQIKKGVKEGGEGCFRAAFEDKILKSDIIFCKTWFKMPMQKFYNPISSFEPTKLMKTTWELRREHNLSAAQNPDSEYREIQRLPRKFTELQLPKKLQNNLPFLSMETVRLSRKKQLRQKQEAGVPKVMGSKSEREVQALIHRLHTIRNQKQQLKKDKMQEYKRIKEARDRPRLDAIKDKQQEKKREKHRAVNRLQEESRHERRDSRQRRAQSR